MCRVHSLVLWILVAFEVASLILALGEGGFVDIFAFDHDARPQKGSGSVARSARVRYGMYSVAMLIIMAGAYFLDEQTRLQSFGQVMSLQDQNAALAEMMLRWKVLPDLEQSSSVGGSEQQDDAERYPGGGILKGQTAGASEASVGSIGSSSSILPRTGRGAAWHPRPGRTARVRFNLPDLPTARHALPTRQPRELGGHQTAKNLMDVME
eukprot:g8026.t1